ncbi:MAG TPA: ion channel [Candidatus Saccharimonadales bacterium]|nr:ion channel [Candidatus Saccharimonadales bacterium]
MARFEAFGLGSVIAVVVTMIHVTGLNYVVHRSSNCFQSLHGSSCRPVVASTYFAVTILVMLLLHILDTCIWGVILYELRLVPDIRNALYFSANTYTSLGYGDVPLSNDWRELSPLMAISGLFTFACTTSQLFNFMNQYQVVVRELAAAHKK